MAKYLLTAAASFLFAGSNLVSAAFLDSGSLNAARWLHTTTALPDGTAVAIGGSTGLDGSTIVGTTELFDPITLTWTALPDGNLLQPRFNHRAVWTPYEELFVIGGQSIYTTPPTGILATVEMYNQTSQTFQAAADLLTARTGHRVEVITNGRILAIGGITNGKVDALSSVEIFDPFEGVWNTTGSLNVGRRSFTSTVLKDGRVFVFGGSKGNVENPSDDINSAEIFDLSTETWTLVAPATTPRFEPITALLDNGNVLVAGGYSNAIPNVQVTSEIYDVQNDVWTPTGDLVTGVHTIGFTKLFDGKVIAAGGNMGSYVTVVQEYDPATGLWTQVDTLSLARHGHTLTILQNGLLLIAGGLQQNYTPLTLSQYSYKDGPCHGHGSLGWDKECTCDFGFQGASCGECVNGNAYPDCIFAGIEEIDVSQGFSTGRPPCNYAGDIGANVPYLVCTLNFVGSGDAVIYTETTNNDTDPLLYLFLNDFSDPDLFICSDDAFHYGPGNLNSAFFIQSNEEYTYYIVASIYNDFSDTNYSIGVNSVFEYTITCGAVDVFGHLDGYYLGKPYFNNDFDHTPVFPFTAPFDSAIRSVLKSYYLTDSEGLAVEYGIEIPLGHTLESHGYDVYNENEFPQGPSLVAVLPFDANAVDAGVPINHVGVFYNPWGHGGKDEWLISHYDLHFHLDTPHTVSNIKCFNPDDLECSSGPEDQVLFAKDTRALPDHFVCDHGVALMGAHCFDPTDSSSFYTDPAYLLGSHKGKFNFIEPMVSLWALSFVSDEYCWDAPQLKCHHKAGFYPTKLCIKKVNANFARVAFVDLLWQSADCDYPTFSGKVSSLNLASFETAEPVNRKKACVVFNENVLEAGWIAEDVDGIEYCCRSHGAFDVANDECLVNCDRHSLVDAPFLKDTANKRCYYNCHPLI